MEFAEANPAHLPFAKLGLDVALATFTDIEVLCELQLLSETVPFP